MAFCSKCGAKNADDARFCNSCGEKLVRPSAEVENTSSGETIEAGQNRNGADNAQNYDSIDSTLEALKKMFLSTSGRLDRITYVKRILILGFALGFITGFIGSLISYRASITLSFIIGLASLPMFYSLNLRRLHDMNRDNKLAIIFLVISVMIQLQMVFRSLNYDMMILFFIANLGVTAFMAFQDGTHGPNQYGPDPLNR